MPNTDLCAFDLDQALSTVDGDHELLTELTELFLEDAPGLVQQIQGAAACNDFDELGRAAHTLKGSVATIGGRALAEAARRLEDRARDEDGTELVALAAEVRAAFEQLQEALASWTA